MAGGALGEHTETTCGSATRYLQAVARRSRVRLALTATVFEDEAEAVTGCAATTNLSGRLPPVLVW